MTLGLSANGDCHPGIQRSTKEQETGSFATQNALQFCTERI